MLCNVEKFILEVSNKPLEELRGQIETIIDFCIGDIGTDKLNIEAAMITDFVKPEIDTYQMRIK